MDEGRRFLRYVLPGLIYSVETTLLIWITCPNWVNTLCLSLNSNKDNLTAQVLGSVLVFAALGYIFSSAFHTLHLFCNRSCKEEDRILDHRFIASCIKEKYENSPDTAMAISYAQWYKQINLGNIHVDANKKVQSLGDQAFGFGAAFMASNFAILSALIICAFELQYQHYPIGRLAIMHLVGLSITYWFGSAYERVGKIAHETYEIILDDALSIKPKKDASEKR